MGNLIGDSSDPMIAAVQGTQSGDGGTGVLGVGPANGVIGQSTGSGFSGVYGQSNTGPGVTGESTTSVGVDAKSQGGPAALRAVNEGDGPGVVGSCHGNGFSGVYGQSNTGPGVTGESTTSVGVDAKSQGGPAALRAVNEGDGPGVVGSCHGNGFSGVYGQSNTGPGVTGESTTSVGVDAKSQGGPAALRAVNEGDGPGVVGSCHGNGFSGVYGQSNTGPGVTGESATSVGVDAKSQGGPAALRAVHAGDGLAGLFGGNVHVTRNLVVDGDVQLTGADLAEQFAVVGLLPAEPGSVVVLAGEDHVRVSDQAYDRRVAGIVSGAGNYRPGIVLDRQAELNRCPLALTGKVWCKVDADSAPVEIGDMLTSSATPGHAMRATDPSRAFGAVIGKALGSLPAGRGLIPVLVALQ